MTSRLRQCVKSVQDNLQDPQTTTQSSVGSSPVIPNGEVSRPVFSDTEIAEDLVQPNGQKASADSAGSLRRSLVGIVAVLAILGCLGAAWYWTPLRRWVDIKEISGLAACVRENPLAPVLVIAAFTIGGLVMFPATLLIVATAVTFEPAIAFVYSLLGCLSSAVALFLLGHWVGRETVRRLVGTRLNRLSSALSRRGLITVITVRIFPVGPYSIVNFVAGVSPIRFWDYVLGTVIGLIPGVGAVTVFGSQLESALLNPGLENLLILAAVITLIAFANIVIHRWFERRSAIGAAESPPER